MATVDDRDEEGADPQEEVGPEGCAPLPAQCDLAPGERDAPPEESDFSPDEELVDQFPIEPIPVAIDPADGLPKPVDLPTVFAPPFDHEHVVCIEDARTYVEVFVGEVEGIEWPALSYNKRTSSRGELLLTPRIAWPRRSTDAEKADGSRIQLRYPFDEDGQRRKRETYEPDDVLEYFGHHVVRVAQDTFRLVRPRRPQCRYYRRQVFNNDEQPDPNEPLHFIHFSHCEKRRSIGGAHMSLRDQAVYACTHRDPRDDESEHTYIDAFDERRLREQGHKRLIPLFGLEGEDVVIDEEQSP